MHCGGAVTQGAVHASAVRQAPADDLSEQLSRATAGEYQILAELGRGGMAAVFLAEDLALGRRVAIKAMIPGLGGAEGMADRFLLEARTAAQLSHPHIIPIHAVRTTGQLRFFVMKYIAGRSLDRVLAETGPLPPAVVQAILAQVASALEHAHRRGVVHRDIKPANIMLDEDGAAIVADFGIAKVAQAVSLTQAGSSVGTPTYMSPEQCTGRPVTGASDQYALGCVAFELVAGRPPFVHQEVVPVLLAHVSDAPPPLLQFRADCPLELAAAVDKMLAKDPDDRWPNLAEAVAAAEAGPYAMDPVVRERMRELAGVEAGDPLPPLPSIPVSPMPLPRTVVSAPRIEPGPGAEVFTVSIQPNGALLQAGSGLQLHATPRDRSGLTVVDAPIGWSSSAPERVTVSNSGVVTARLEGEAEVTASSGSARATVQVRVARVPVGRVRITGPSGVLRIGERNLLAAVAVDQSGAVLPGRPVRWTSLDPAVAAVDVDGTVTGNGAGQARIQAESEAQVAEVMVEVRGGRGELRILPAEGALAVGQVVQLVAVLREAGEMRPVGGAAWSSSDPTVLRIASDGEVTAFRPGTARIRASFGDQMVEVTLQSTRVDVAQVGISPRPSTLGAGEEIALKAEATDRLGSVLQGRIVTWTSSHPDIASIGPDGVLRGIAAGTVRISATVGAGLAWMELRITPVSISLVRLEPGSLLLRTGESAPVRALVQGARGGTLARVPVEWQSSDPSVASVNRDGIVTGLRFGTARIAATAGGRRATLAVEVRAPTLVSSPRVPLGPT